MRDETISAREAIERLLAHRVMSEPGFLEQLVLDPAGTAKPVLSEILADDGELDLGQLTVNVHFESENTVHLVVPLRSDDLEASEVAGFARRPGMPDLRGIEVFPPILGAGTGGGSLTDSYMCTGSGVCPCSGAECSGD